MNGLIRTSLCVLMLFMPACGTLEITVLGTPTPDMAAYAKRTVHFRDGLIEPDHAHPGGA